MDIGSVVKTLFLEAEAKLIGYGHWHMIIAGILTKASGLKTNKNFSLIFKQKSYKIIF